MSLFLLILTFILGLLQIQVTTAGELALPPHHDVVVSQSVHAPAAAQQAGNSCRAPRLCPAP